MQIVTSWMEQGIAKGRIEGEQRGRTEGERSLVLLQLPRRVGTLPATVEAQFKR